MPKVHFVEPRGTERAVDAPAGWSVMEAAVKNGVSGILADCGGACSCATCHVYVDSAWIDRLPPPSEIERSMLELAIDPRPASRLSCQLALNDALDGLVVTVPQAQF